MSCYRRLARPRSRSRCTYRTTHIWSQPAPVFLGRGWLSLCRHLELIFCMATCPSCHHASPSRTDIGNFPAVPRAPVKRPNASLVRRWRASEVAGGFICPTVLGFITLARRILGRYLPPTNPGRPWCCRPLSNTPVDRSCDAFDGPMPSGNQICAVVNTENGLT